MKTYSLVPFWLTCMLGFGLLFPAPPSASEPSQNSLEGPSPGQTRTARRRTFKPMIDEIAAKRGLDTALVHAVIAAESGYDPNAVSPKGAVGLMQVMPATAGDYGLESVEALFDPRTNVEIGTRHLRRLMRKYQNMRQAIMAYNAGEGAIARTAGLGIYDETRLYTLRVLNHYWRNKGQKPLDLRKLGLTGRVRLTLPSTVKSLDPGLHAPGPKSQPMFVLESKN